MLSEKFLEVIANEGVVSITSWGNEDPHVTCTWNSYLVIKDNDKILIPAAGMNSTEGDVKVNNRLIITLGSRAVEGFNGYQGTGFRVEGVAEFLSEGEYFDEMKAKYPFLNRVLLVNVKSSKQLL
ncbi:MAG: FMN-binding protein [Tissierellia bacterium]|nr:FMN-binding protein [Tissierellia bacterium]